ncbi:MAG: integron integrase [Thermoanaerobaculaceae bacterium]
MVFTSPGFTGTTPILPPPSARVLEAMRESLRRHNYRLRTEEAYLGWARRFIVFHRMRHPEGLGEAELRQFLTHLALARKVSSSTQNQALAALLYLFREVLGRGPRYLEGFAQARSPKRLPEVLTRPQVRQLLGEMGGGERWLQALLLYGSGLRLRECLRLRVKDLDIEGRQLVVRDGKGAKDRTTILAECAVGPLGRQLEAARGLWAEDRAFGRSGAYALTERPRPAERTAAEWPWYWVFPAPHPALDTDRRASFRPHACPRALQSAIADAARRAGLGRRVTPHTLRHAFATHLLADGTSIRVIQELLGHRDLGTTMIYTHLVPREPRSIISPSDRP